MSTKTNLLLVEDNPGDADLIRESLESDFPSCELYHTEDGVEAMAFLRKQGRYVNFPTPDLLLMDLNMPRKSGREVLSEMKQDTALRRIPVVIMSSSQAEEDIAELYDLQASAYIEKPIELDHYHRLIQAVGTFWLKLVHYPFKGDE